MKRAIYWMTLQTITKMRKQKFQLPEYIVLAMYGNLCLCDNWVYSQKCHQSFAFSAMADFILMFSIKHILQVNYSVSGNRYNHVYRIYIIHQWTFFEFRIDYFWFRALSFFCTQKKNSCRKVSKMKCRKDNEIKLRFFAIIVKMWTIHCIIWYTNCLKSTSEWFPKGFEFTWHVNISWLICAWSV